MFGKNTESQTVATAFGWISASARLPSQPGAYLILWYGTCAALDATTLLWDGQGWAWDQGDSLRRQDDVAFWLPVPPVTPAMMQELKQ